MGVGVQAGLQRWVEVGHRDNAVLAQSDPVNLILEILVIANTILLIRIVTAMAAQLKLIVLDLLRPRLLNIPRIGYRLIREVLQIL